MSKNRGLNKAQRVKDDECYTRIEDIDKEIAHYPEAFDGKAVYCNCDDPRRSQFVRYFLTHFDRLGLRRLDASGLDPDFRGVGLTCISQPSDVDEYIESNTIDLFDGSFDWYENRRTLAESDIVVTNPPFSLFRKYIGQLVALRKQFIVLGNYNAVAFKEIFDLFKLQKMRRGAFSDPSNNMFFDTPSGGEKRAAVSWYTSIAHRGRPTQVQPFRLFDGSYRKYDNFDAIECPRLVDIPIDYNGMMGVPITYLERANDDLFELIGRQRDVLNGEDFKIDGKRKYARLVIKRRHPVTSEELAAAEWKRANPKPQKQTDDEMSDERDGVPSFYLKQT